SINRLRSSAVDMAVSVRRKLTLHPVVRSLPRPRPAPRWGPASSMRRRSILSQAELLAREHADIVVVQFAAPTQEVLGERADLQGIQRSIGEGHDLIGEFLPGEGPALDLVAL